MNKLLAFLIIFLSSCTCQSSVSISIDNEKELDSSVTEQDTTKIGHTLYGTVYIYPTPIAGASVSLFDITKTVLFDTYVTEPSGRFVLKVPSTGRFLIICYHPTYKRSDYRLNINGDRYITINY